ncbi:unnamed protein product [Rotaria sp. Silwood1]|nr:unnamed protein product [Rotaria sp. Silwood1]CAF4736117.1 unnamed protein product [Rotaria sp. Silwood1]
MDFLNFLTVIAIITFEIGTIPSWAVEIDLYTKSYYLNCGTLSGCQQFSYPWTYRGKYIENQIYDFNAFENGGNFCHGQLSITSRNETHYRIFLRGRSDPDRECDLNKQPNLADQCSACFSRLEFISGGWCMNDEASTHYNSIIDQHSLGAEFLRDQLGECARPKIGWQIDPFGHSREVASLFAQDDPSSPEYNVPERVQAFINIAHNEVCEPMGVVQHHDALSGTEKQEVANDYAKRLSAGIDIATHLRIEFDDKGNMHKIVNKDKQIAIPLAAQGLYWYPSYPGNNSGPDFQGSGAYIFRPWSQEARPVNDSRTIICTLTETVQSALIIYNDWASFEVSLHSGSLAIELEWTVGPIAIDDNIGKEVIMRYDTDIESAATFYTDANGREVLQRIRDYRPTWNYTVTEPVSGNYYPVNSRIWVKDSTRQFTVLTDRSEGGSSMKDGSIEVMLHRRILHDDSLGVGEPLNETAYGQGLVVRGRHSLILEPPTTSARNHRVNAQRMHMHTLATYAAPQLSYADYSSKYRQTWSALSSSMPINVHLLTFDQLKSKQYLVRVEHFFELNEDAVYSQPTTFDLQSLFNSLGSIKELLELTLGANMQLADVHRLVWVTTEGEVSNSTSKQSSLTGTMVTLNPMQIRTFQVTLQ